MVGSRWSSFRKPLTRSLVRYPKALDLRTSPEEFGRELRLAAAAEWYEVGRISQGKAAELAGLNRAEFIPALSKCDVRPIQTQPEELEDEIRNTLNERASSDA